MNEVGFLPQIRCKAIYVTWSGPGPGFSITIIMLRDDNSCVGITIDPDDPRFKKKRTLRPEDVEDIVLERREVDLPTTRRSRRTKDER